MKKFFRHLLKCALCCSLIAAAQAQELVTLPGDSPLVDIAIQFPSGSVNDPADLHGLNYLTALSLSEASTQDHSYKQLLDAFYPWAVSVESTSGKERTTFHATVHRDNLAKFTPLLVEMLSRPKFSEDDLKRLKDKAKNYLTQDLRVNNDEELGKEALYLELYPKSHPYGHHNFGDIAGLEAITADDLQHYFQQHFGPEGVVIGLAGGYPKDYPSQLKSMLKSALPHLNPKRNQADAVEIAEPAPPTGRRVTIVEKDTRSVAMSLGFPISVNRSDPDWAALFLFRSFLGEHRSSNSYLYQQLREARGLNYGDYAYIEYFPNGMYLMQPEPYYPRTSQIFQIWIRPVKPETAVFTLRATFYELEKVLREGLTEQQFEATRSFLKKNAPLLVASSARRLGYTLDDRFYQADPFVERLRRDLDKLTLDQVNAIIRRHIQANNMEIVLVSKNGEELRQKLMEGAPSPMTYNSEKPDSVLKEDRIIETYPLKLDEITVVPVNSFFR